MKDELVRAVFVRDICRKETARRNAEHGGQKGRAAELSGQIRTLINAAVDMGLRLPVDPADDGEALDDYAIWADGVIAANRAKKEDTVAAYMAFSDWYTAGGVIEATEEQIAAAWEHHKAGEDVERPGK